MTDLATNPQDFAIIGGKRTPGPACELVGAALARKWDTQQGAGQSGGRLVYKGRDFSEFSIRLRLLDADDWAEWTEFQPTLEQSPTGTGRARTVQGLAIVHPITDMLGIHSIVVLSIGQPELGDQGDYTIDIKVKEYRDPEPSQARARGSRNSEQNDPVAREIDRLTHQVQELAAQG
jgi:hypothetical protein